MDYCQDRTWIRSKSNMDYCQSLPFGRFGEARQDLIDRWGIHHSKISLSEVTIDLGNEKKTTLQRKKTERRSSNQTIVRFQKFSNNLSKYPYIYLISSTCPKLSNRQTHAFYVLLADRHRLFVKVEEMTRCCRQGRGDNMCVDRRVAVGWRRDR